MDGKQNMFSPRRLAYLSKDLGIPIPVLVAIHKTYPIPDYVYEFLVLADENDWILTKEYACFTMALEYYARGDVILRISYHSSGHLYICFEDPRDTITYFNSENGVHIDDLDIVDFSIWRSQIITKLL